MRAASSALDDPAFGLTLATRRSRAEGFDLLGYLMLHSTTLGDAILRLSRFSGLWAQGLEVHVDTPPNGRLEFVFRAPASQCWPHIQSAVAGSVVVGRAITGRDWRPAVVKLSLPKPSVTEPYEKLLGDGVRFDQPETSISLSQEEWDYKIVGSDERLRAHLEKTARDLLARVETDDSPTGRAREYIARHLETTGVTLASTARALGMSRRTLQRRLSEQNESFASLVDQVRRDLALHLIENEQLEVKQAAFRLGFAQPSAFSRAFKRWTGSSPIAYTRQ